jgi:DNA-binding NtrC family response regulator
VYSTRQCQKQVKGIVKILMVVSLDKYCGAIQTEPKHFNPCRFAKPAKLSRRGNTRLLENEVERLVASVRSKSITEDHLDDSIRNLRAPVQSFRPKKNRCQSRRRLDPYQTP